MDGLIDEKETCDTAGKCARNVGKTVPPKY